MSAIKIIQALARKALTKNQGSGIRSIPSAMEAEAKAGEIAAILQSGGMPLQQLDNFIRSEKDLLKFLNIIENANKPRVIPGTSAEGKAITEKFFGKRGEVVDFPQPRTFKQEIDAMKKSGDIVDPNNLKKNDNVLTREMFQNSNLNKPTIEGQMEKITGASNRIDEIMKEQADMYRPKTDAEIKAKFKKQNKESIQRFKDKMKKDEPDDMASGGRAGYYTGGITDVEPSLDDIGHGADAMMSRTRLMSPGSQTTTSTGLNYLLAEDNDNMRIPFGDGLRPIDKGFFITPPDPYEGLSSEEKEMRKALDKIMSERFQKELSPEDIEKIKIQQEIRKRQAEERGFPEGLQLMNQGGRTGFAKGKIAKEVLNKGRRGFMKAAGAAGAGIAALKTGLLGFGEKAAPVVEKVAETVSETAQGVPSYFFKLVDKIKSFGEDVTEKAATLDRQKVTKYKDFELTEDVATGEMTIQRMKVLDDGSESYYGKPLTEETYMNYKPGKGQADESTKGIPPDEYEQGTAYIRSDREYAGEVVDESFEISDDVLEEVGETITKKAEGGRIGFNKGKLVMEGGRKFLEKVFGKEKLKNIVDNDPELEQGMLEVVEMFRNKDKKGLKMYLQKYLPHMDDAEIEDFIVSSGDSAGIEGQLIRLGSGRDYKNKIEMIEEANNIRKLKDFDVEGVSKNAEGGRIGLFLGGKLIKNQLTDGKSLLRKMLNFMAEKSTAGKKGSELLQIVNPKQLDPFLNDPRTMGKVSSEAPAGIAEIINAKKKEMTEDRASMVGDIISSARKFKKVDDDIINYKKSIINDMVGRGIDKETAAEMAENLAKMVETGAGKGSTPNITEKGLLELENIQKNLLTKDRKLQAQGGLTTMLGE